MSNDNPLAKQRGISLVETVITLAILSIGLIALFKVQSYLVGHSATNKQQSEATTLAEEKIEQLRDFQQIASSNSVKSYDDIASGSQSISGIGANYTMSWTITNHNTAGHKTIDVKVSWNDRFQVSHSIKLSSMIAKVDPTLTGAIIGSGAGAIQPSSNTTGSTP